MLENATKPVVSKVPLTNEAVLKAAATKDLGNERFRLLVPSVFNPAEHRGHKVAVKGLLITAGNENRINLTSLQTVAESCGSRR